MNFSKLSSLLLISTLSLSYSAFADPSVIAQKTIQAQKVYKMDSYQLFVPSQQRNATVDAAIENVSYLKLDVQQLRSLINRDAPMITFKVPTSAGTYTVVMKRNDIYSQNFAAHTLKADGTYEKVNYNKGDFYRGYVVENDNSLVALSFYENEIGGIISISGVGNFNLVIDKNNPGINNENYFIYNERDIINGTSMITPCELGEKHTNFEKNIKPEATLTSDGNCRGFSLSLYGDYALYSNNASNLTNTQNYLTTLFNGNATLFENENIQVELANMYVNTTPDNYPNTSSDDVLMKFGNDINTNTTADIMQLVTGLKQNGYPSMGGLAWLDQLCETPFYYRAYDSYIGPFSMVNNEGIDDLPFIPVYSWDIEASNHEIGHNLGSPHTQSCSWNGNNTTIDGCYQPEGRCARGPIPGLGEGTIMSYCHLTSVGIDLVNGYGPQPGDLIRASIRNATCLTNTATRPSTIMDTASVTQIGTNFCESNGWYYVYDNKNDADPANDELVMMIQKAGAFTNVNITDAEVGVITNDKQGTLTTDDYGTYDYSLYTNWNTINRKFYIKLPQQVNGEVNVKFLYSEKDVQDLRARFPYIQTSDRFYAQIFTTENAFLNPNLATTATIVDLEHTTNQTSANSWSNLASSNDYIVAHIRYTGNFYGGTLAYGDDAKNTSVNKINPDVASIYPNPTNNKVYVDLKNKTNVTLLLVDNLGRTLQHIVITGSKTEINLGNYANGIYTLRFNIDGVQYNQKIVKH